MIITVWRHHILTSSLTHFRFINFQSPFSHVYYIRQLSYPLIRLPHTSFILGLHLLNIPPILFIIAPDLSFNIGCYFLHTTLLWFHYIIIKMHSEFHWYDTFVHAIIWSRFSIIACLLGLLVVDEMLYLSWDVILLCLNVGDYDSFDLHVTNVHTMDVDYWYVVYFADVISSLLETTYDYTCYIHVIYLYLTGLTC